MSADRILGGRYVLDHVLGQGGMAVVHLARDICLERLVAVKVLRGDLARDSLHRYYLTAVLSALEASHRAGVVHRDLKPANVMVMPDDTVKVVDFGIAHLIGDPVATATRGFLGTAEYLSPEQVQGRSIDARSDLYSAGCLLYELVTARPPFVGDHAVAVAYQHVHEGPPRASTYRAEITPELDEVLLTVLAKDPGCRYQSARSFAGALRSAADGLLGTVGLADPDPGHEVVPLPLRSALREDVTPALAPATGAGLRSAAGGR